MDSYSIKAYGKINLGLDVVSRMENGYHQVRMIMQTVSLFDELIMTPCEEGISIFVDSKDIPTDEHNLIYKAIKIMKDTYNITEGVRVDLKKQIPVAAGMAGGSSDAAAAFRGMNQLFKLGLHRDRLCELGVKVGADVPYCILGGTALAEGIGEKLTPLPSPPDCHILLVKPDISVSTKYVYDNLKLSGEMEHVDIDGMRHSIENGNLLGITKRMGNVLEQVTVGRYPIIQEIKDKMITYGAMNSLMSGSGPTVFGIFEREETGKEAYEQMKKMYDTYEIHLVSIEQNIETSISANGV
ncbi:4-(cytidine 5'-diphospho)-2-C-methyl-D-erythritol kinase [Lachnospiraceae bacterium OttesenSCG-928-D06]|nr:4-(cytidine 5'-diphospho)-2-C-methyl-D-erythritol kinase [Lachnospiraceae bacterium OttesenSCG-928-D06]